MHNWKRRYFSLLSSTIGYAKTQVSNASMRLSPFADILLPSIAIFRNFPFFSFGFSRCRVWPLKRAILDRMARIFA